MKRMLMLVCVTFLVHGCGSSATPTPDIIATKVVQALAVAGTLTRAGAVTHRNIHTGSSHCNSHSYFDRYFHLCSANRNA